MRRCLLEVCPSGPISPVFRLALILGVRYYLTYHTHTQVAWGFSIGVLFGAVYYTLIELVPARYPDSFLGRARSGILATPLFTFFRIRDGWAVWDDGGLDTQYLRWRETWDASRSSVGAKKRQ